MRSPGVHLNHEPSRDGVGQPGLLVTLDATLARSHLMMADLTAAGRLEGEPLAGPAEVTGQTSDRGVSAVREGVGDNPDGSSSRVRLLREARTCREDRQEGPDEQAPAAVRQPGPGVERGGGRPADEAVTG